MKKSYVVVGLGRFGSAAAIRLSELGNEVLAIDNNADLVQRVSPFVTQAVVADSQDAGVLRALGIRDFDCAVIAIGENLSSSILTTLNFKELGVPYIICKAHDDNHKKILEKLGADRVVVPEREFANKLAQGLSSENVLDYIELSSDYGISEFSVPTSWVGKNLRELNVRVKYGVNIIAIRKGSSVQVSPSADYALCTEDTVVALGDYKALSAVQRK